MQQIKGILLVNNGVGQWVDEYGRAKNPAPIITLGVMATLVIDLRTPFQENDDDILPAYPISEFAGLGLCFAMDNDYDKATHPPLITTIGINVSTVNGKTILTIPLPNTNTPELDNIIKIAPSTSFICELTGLSSAKRARLSFEMQLGMKNRVYRPEDGIPEELPDPADPEWITPLIPIIAGKVQESIDALTVADGKSSYTYFGYASDGVGSNFSLVPASGLNFRAEFASQTYIETPTLQDFQEAGAVWHQYIVPGVDGSSTRLYVAYASNAAGADFSLLPGENLRYRAEFVSSSVIDTPKLADFLAAGATFLKYRGEDGLAGAGFVSRGVWGPGIAYAKNELVLYKGGWLLSMSNANNTTPPDPPASNEYWQTIVASGTNGKDITIAYSATGDGTGTDWHSVMATGDKYYRISVNNGVSWSIPRLLSLPPVGIKIQFTASTSPLSPSWSDISYNPENDFSTADVAAYFRYKMAGGVWSDSVLIINLQQNATAEEITEAENLLKSLPLVIQFSDSGDEDSEWHGTILEGDRFVRFYNSTGTVRVVWDLSGYDVDIEAIQVSSTGGMWHSVVQESDLYMRLSLDGGATYMSPWPFKGQNGKSAYQEWLALGNEGTPQEFFDSLKATFPVGTPGQVLLLGPSGPYWGDLAAYTPVTPPPEPPEDVDLGLEDLPDGVEKRIWEYLPVRRPSDGRALHLFWQSSADGQTWGTLYSSATHPHCVKTLGANNSKIEFSTAFGPAMLPVEYIPVLEIHVRTCWGYLEEGIWHKGDWTYHNTLGVKLSLEGLPLEKPDYFNPEYFIIPIPEGTDQCEFRLSTDDDFRKETVLFSNSLYETDPKGFFFDGQNLLPATTATTQT
ncbi:MAG: hypothetical protein ACOYI9_13545, partial [Candidatus Hydrogenedentales bacterium]